MQRTTNDADGRALRLIDVAKVRNAIAVADGERGGETA
jgi:hypothetical protein